VVRRWSELLLLAKRRHRFNLIFKKRRLVERPRCRSLYVSLWSPLKGASQPAFRSVGFPNAVVVLAFLPVLSRLGVDLSRKTAVVMVIVVVVVTVVVVGVLGLLVVPMLLRRVMHVRLFVLVMCGMM